MAIKNCPELEEQDIAPEVETPIFCRVNKCASYKKGRGCLKMKRKKAIRKKAVKKKAVKKKKASKPRSAAPVS